MRFIIFCRCFGCLTAIVILSGVVSTAQADPITPSDTVTDLGSGAITAIAANGTTVAITSQFSSGGGGNQLLTAQTLGSPILSITNGQFDYAFNVSPVTVLFSLKKSVSIVRQVGPSDQGDEGRATWI